jgi:hypothetical protein
MPKYVWPAGSEAAHGVVRSTAVRKILRQTPLQFDDIEFMTNHRGAGVLLAVDEFNRTCDSVKIDRWYNIRSWQTVP